MSLMVNYVPDNSNRYNQSRVSTDMENFDEWLDHMVKGNPNLIFFFTTVSTDVDFPEVDDHPELEFEVDRNEVTFLREQTPADKAGSTPLLAPEESYFTRRPDGE